MKIKIKSKLGIGAIALGSVVVGTLAFSTLSPVIALARADDKVYTHSFKNAKPADVLAWMKEVGINVKVDLSEMPDRTLTLVFDGANRDGIVTSFAKTIGFQAEKRGDVYSLLRGIDTVPSNEGYLEASEASEQHPNVARAIELVEMAEQDPSAEREIELAMIADDSFQDGIIEEVMAALEEAGVSREQMKKVKARLTDRLATRHRLPMTLKLEGGEGHSMPKVFAVPGHQLPGMKGFKFEMDEDSMDQGGVRQALEQAMRALERAMSQLEGHGKMGMDHEEMAEFEKHFGKHGNFEFKLDEKAMKDHMKLMEKQFGKHGDFEFKFDEKAMKDHMKVMEKQFGENGTFKLHLDEMHKGLGEGMKVHQFKMENLKKFIKSLSKDQKALAEKQGFLKPSDLTKEQCALLDLGDEKDIDMTFNVDGEKIRIKSGNTKGKLTTTGISA